MNILRSGLLCLFLLLLGMPGVAQYSLEEVGIGLGGGAALQLNGQGSLTGAGSNVDAFFSHWACGKGYGFHITAGGFFNWTGAEKAALSADSSNSAIYSLGPSVGGMLKLRGHSYHRDRETAFFFGGKFRFPISQRYIAGESQALSDLARNVMGFLPGLHASVAFKRPFGEDGHWYLRPGAEYYLLPGFQSPSKGNYSLLYLFLNLEVTLWDQKG